MAEYVWVVAGYLPPELLHSGWREGQFMVFGVLTSKSGAETYRDALDLQSTWIVRQTLDEPTFLTSQIDDSNDIEAY